MLQYINLSISIGVNMKCSVCNNDNLEDARFCSKCGNALISTCYSCHTPAGKDDIYCRICGLRLPTTNLKISENIVSSGALTPLINTTQSSKEINTHSERKTVTVLFGDISGFTAMSEKLDPEEVTTIMNKCLSMMGDVVLSYEGYIDKYIGDCIMAIFGAPITHENDPELAIRAALEMSKKINDFNKDLPIKLEKPLALHIGINTGIVVAGKMGSDSKMDYTVMGDTVNLASRLESQAVRGQTFISAYTYNLTKNLFEFIPHDPVVVKGKRDPVAVYEVVRVLNETEIKGKSSLNIPLIGRERELKLLSDCADRLFKKEGQIIFLISDPGFGKSRIHIELKKRFEHGDVQVIEGRCHSYGRHTPYHTFIDLFKHLCAIDSDDLSDTIKEKLVSGIPLLLGEDKDVLSNEARKAIVLIGKLFEINLSEDFNISINEMSSQELSTATILAIRWIFETISKQKPIVISLEDLHNADTASVEVVASLINSVKSSAIMLLLLLRPDKNVPSAKLIPISKRILGDRTIEISFDRMTRNDSESFIKYFLGIEELPKEILEFVGSRSNGNPLFLQEIVHSLLDNGAIEKTEDATIKILKKLENVSVPSSITGLIMARFDKFPSELHETLTKAAVVGVSFSRSILSALIGDNNLDEKLSALVEAEMIFESQTFPDIEYSFHTSFIQEAIYDTLLLKRRHKLHLEVAQAIIQLYGNRVSEHVETLAMHYLEGGDIPNAFKFIVKSGLKSKEVFSNENAAKFLKQAIDLGIQMENPEPSIADIYKSYSEVLELLGDMEGAISAWKNIIDLSDEALSKANSMRNIGRIEEKRGLKDNAIKIYEEAIELIKDKSESIEYALLQMNLSWVLNRYRKVDEAIKIALEALQLLEKHNIKEHIALCCNNLAVFYEAIEEFDLALDYNLRSLNIFKELKLRRQIGNVELSLGYLRTKRNEMDEALDHFTKSADAMDRIGNRIGSATALLAKGRCYSDIKRYDEAEIALLSALRNFRELEILKRVVATQISLASVLLDKKDTQSAHEQIDDAISTVIDDNNKSDLAKLKRLSARAFRQNGKEQESDKNYEDAYGLFIELGREKDAKATQREWKG